MKKSVRIMLSLLLCLSLLSALPACAAEPAVYTIPKTVAVTVPFDGARGTMTYSVSGDTLTETSVIPDEDSSGLLEYGDLAFLPGSADLNQQLISVSRATTDYPVLPNPMIFSPLLRSGKINQVVIHETRIDPNETGKTRSRKSQTTLPVKAQNGHVVQFGKETYSYDAKGNLVRQILPAGNAKQTATITYSYDQDNRLSSIRVRGDLGPGDPEDTFQWTGNTISSSSQDLIFTVSQGKIVQAAEPGYPDEFQAVFDSQGRYQTFGYPFADHSVTYQTISL